MTYLTHSRIVYSQDLRGRIIACAAQEGVSDPPRWVSAVLWSLIGSDWIAAWASAEVANPGQDHGANEGVITDQMILSAVQAKLGN